MKSVLEFERHSECAALTDLVRSSASAAGGASGTARSLKRAGRFWLPNGPFTRMYFLERGRLTLVSAAPSRRETVLHAVAAGEWFGEYCFCAESRLHHPEIAARADEDCLLREVESGRFLRELSGNAIALRRFIEIVCRHLARADRRVDVLARRGARARVCALLLELAETRGTVSPASSRYHHLAITHAEVAAMTAMNRPNVSLTLGALRRRGLIQYGRNQPILVDCRKVRAFLDRLDEHA